MTDLLTADIHELRHCVRITALNELRDEIMRQCREKWEAELAEAKRQAAWDALTDYAATFSGIVLTHHAVYRYRDTHYALTPRSVTLSDGSVVTLVDGRYKRSGATVGLIVSVNWRDLVVNADTGSDWDALKAFAGAVEKK